MTSSMSFNSIRLSFLSSLYRDSLPSTSSYKSATPSVAVHSGLKQQELIDRYKLFKEFQKRILVATDLFGRGIDIEKVNVVVNYDMPSDSDSYLHRVGRAGRFGTKGLAITFSSSEEDTTVLKDVQSRFEVSISECPEQIDPTTYLNAWVVTIIMRVVCLREMVSWNRVCTKYLARDNDIVGGRQQRHVSERQR